ncbi:FecR family protein [Sphingosinicella rhizophila]|uniref:FecR domain-containing protein n=1 Tax=Sphingosinicella rhizophila TaxID=3050082 RepID=A0ABU3QBS0_9SPHN|nr:FecR domain-containing protein [Sphingosinicella sp. GR2756]MDT9600843.1 FecR domain-containing protein [Sphingosinicella sp. GR2756]
MSSAEIDRKASEWLARRDGDRWSNAAQADLDQWLAESTLHRVSYLRLQKAWQRMNRLSALQVPSTDAEPLDEERADQARRRRWARWSLAAGIAATMGLTATLVHDSDGVVVPAQVEPAVYATAIGGQEIVPLSDGTRVELNTDTRIRAQLAANERRVWLDQGEAYFEVAHDAARPFVVDAGARRVTVLGTKFSVRRDGDSVEVAVIEGRVRVEAPAGEGEAKIVTGGDMVIAKPVERNLLVVRQNLGAVEKELSWREGVLNFDSTSLADVVAEFNRYNRRKMVIADPATAAIRIEGMFNATDGEAFARMLREAFGLEVDMRKEKIIISG